MDELFISSHPLTSDKLIIFRLAIHDIVVMLIKLGFTDVLFTLVTLIELLYEVINQKGSK